MNSTKEIVLGISPGIRHVGIAVLSDNRWLREARVRTVRGEDIIDRLTDVVKVIQKAIDKEHVTAIAIKLNHPCRTSEFIEQIVDTVEIVAAINDLKLKVYKIEDLHTRLLSKTQARNTGSLAVSLLKRFPELYGSYAKSCSEKRYYYYIKMFEAVACATAAAEYFTRWKYEKL
jgi:hypothetical protein